MKTIKKVSKAQRGIDVERAATHRGVCGKGSVSDRQAARMDRREERQSRREERRNDRELRREERRQSRESSGGSSFGSGWKNGGSMKKKPSMKKGGSFPDLNKDGKITKADILKGRGVIAKKGTTVKKAQNGDSTKYYYNQSTKDIMNATKAIKEKGSSSKEYNDAFKKQTESLGNLRRQSLKGKPGYDKMGNPVKKNKMGGKTPKTKMKMGGMTKKCAYGCK